MKCSAIKLSEPLTFSYKGAYLPQSGCLCRGPPAHKCRLKDENLAVYVEISGEHQERGELGVNREL